MNDDFSHRYELFGLHVAANRALGDLPLPPCTSDAAVDVTVDFETALPEASDEVVFERVVGDERLTVFRSAGGWWWKYPDDAVFWVGPDCTEVRAHWPEHYVIEDSMTYFLGPILGFALRKRNKTLLHASTVARAGRGALVVGHAGAGKSTTAATLASRDFLLVSEDIACLDEHDEKFAVRPGFGFAKLWDDSAARFGDLPLLTPNWSKRYLNLESRLSREPVQVDRIYFLAPGAPAGDLVELSRRDAVVELIDNVYLPYSLDAKARAGDFDVLGRLAQRVPAKKLGRGESLDTLGAVVAAFEADFG